MPAGRRAGGPPSAHSGFNGRVLRVPLAGLRLRQPGRELGPSRPRPLGRRNGSTSAPTSAISLRPQTSRSP
eukprot:6818166-Alexandrium_andersonii.AAC.1